MHISKKNKRDLHKKFFLSAIMSPLDIGALCSSSSSLASCIVDVSNFQPNEKIIEVGAGTGAITAEINSRLPYNGNFTSVEKNSKFAGLIRERFQGKVEVIEADIRDIDRDHFGEIDCLISSLPMTLWKNDLQKDIITSMHSLLASHGRMIFFSYLTSNIFGGKNMLLSNLSESFSTVREYKIVWKNTPPAKIYICTNNCPS